MKTLVIYWILGCIIIGPTIGHRMNDCPKEHLNELALVTAIAAWPALLIAAVVFKKADTSCHFPLAGTGE